MLEATGKDIIDDRNVCTLDKEGSGTCSGDSGGPLSQIVNGIAYQVGIVSFGLATPTSNCDTFYPSVFTAIKPFCPYIEQNTGVACDPTV